MSQYRILCLGNQWLGSDDGSIFNAFSRQGHSIYILDHKFYIPSDARSFISKLVGRIVSQVYLSNYNNDIVKSYDLFKPDIICVYKGNNILPNTLRAAKQKGIPIFCIYPDVSLFDHGSIIPKLIPYYDYIFTTKSFGITDLNKHFGFTNVSLIHHCIDPNVHKEFNLLETDFSNYANDISFIGSYSNKKEKVIAHINENISDLDLKIWGGSWSKATIPSVIKCYMNAAVYGDMYSVAVQKSKINLGILSESGINSSNGDLITSRSFHIPGCGGFLLHERTPEILDIYKEGESIVTYESNEDLCDKIKFYLKNDSERERIRVNSHDLVWRYHKSDDRVSYIIDILKQKHILA